jgi:transcriptional regulator of nitric oxide reductase
VVKRIGAVIVLVVATFGLAVVAQQRIFTNPRPEGYFKTLFPNAAAFSTFGGTPLHWKAYGVDPKAAPNAAPIGIIFWTTDMVPNEVGYHGPIHMLVGLDMTGIITGVIVDYNSEPYGYFSVEPPRFPAQFKGKSVRDPFRVGGDVDAVSRATITISSAARAIRDSSRIVARALLNPDMVKPPQP